MVERTRAERRERKRNARKRRIRKHGMDLAKIYRDAVTARAKRILKKGKKVVSDTVSGR